MPDGRDALQVERCVELRECVDTRCNVEQRLGPAAAVPDPPVLEVPGGEPVCREIEAERGHERAVVLLSPVPAVDDDHQSVRPGAFREEQLRELARMIAVPVYGA